MFAIRRSTKFGTVVQLVVDFQASFFQCPKMDP